MRSHEERVAAVRQRITQEEQKKRLRRSRMITACSAAACLVLIVGLSVLMPGILQNMSTDSYDGFAMAASMFGENEAIGYIIIGLLSFCWAYASPFWDSVFTDSSGRMRR